MNGWDNAPEYGFAKSRRRAFAWVIISVVIMAAMVACSLRANAQPAELVGVASVTDGDTIELHGQTVRLSGFDAPEHGSQCGQTDVYQRASNALAAFIGSRVVHCALTGARTHGRAVGTCRVGGTDVGDHMVREGWARDWPRYSRGVYADEEADARSARRGIWGLQCPSDLWGNRNYTRS